MNEKITRDYFDNLIKNMALSGKSGDTIHALVTDICNHWGVRAPCRKTIYNRKRRFINEWQEMLREAREG